MFQDFASPQVPVDPTSLDEDDVMLLAESQALARSQGWSVGSDVVIFPEDPAEQGQERVELHDEPLVTVDEAKSADHLYWGGPVPLQLTPSSCTTNPLHKDR